MRRGIRQTCSAALLLFVAVWLSACSAAAAQEAESLEPEPIEASGFIEAEEVSVVSEVGGRVAEVLADEADTVTAGQVVVRLDAGLLEAERAQIQAAIAVAKADLSKIKAGADKEELDAAKATIEEIEKNITGAKNTAGAAWSAASDPQGIDVQISSAEMEVELALQQIEIAKAELEKAEYLLVTLERTEEDDRSEIAIEFQGYKVEILRANLRAAEARYEGAKQKLELLEAQRERPVSIIALARNAQASVGVYEARLEIAQADYDMLVNGARREEIAIMDAQVALAEANLALLDAQIDQLTLVAPIDGVVTTRAIHPGETASPGVSLLSIADLSDLKLVVYIPETQIGRVRLNVPVEITVDAYPSQVFEGLITYISGEAEFTPRNVQTEEERVNLVYAVEIRIDNKDGKLKPGMPADVVIETVD
jgi:HlyD family secretion protein